MTEDAQPADPGSSRAKLPARVTGNRIVAVLLGITVVVAAVLTFFVLAEAPDIGPDIDTVLLVLYGIGLVLLVILAVVAWRVVQLWRERRRGLAGVRLHVKFVFLFSLVAVTPAILVAVFSSVFLNAGLESWFSKRVRTALEAASEVSEVYLDDYKWDILADTALMVAALKRKMPLDPDLQYLVIPEMAEQALNRGITETAIFDDRRKVLARTGYSTIATQLFEITNEDLKRARYSVQVLPYQNQDQRVRAVVMLASGYNGGSLYLYAARAINPVVTEHRTKYAGAMSRYESLEQRRSGLQLAFGAVFSVLSLLILLAAIWFGFSFATELSHPITQLIAAAERIRHGDLSIRVAEVRAGDELGLLSRVFNRMTTQLASQRQELIDANRLIDSRRRFTEAVLAGVSAGVIGLEPDGRINLPNRKAEEMLGNGALSLINKHLTDVFNEAVKVWEQAKSDPENGAEAQVRISRDGRHRILQVRVVVEIEAETILGYVITFNDITDLLAAQRTAAWADVARRIAHEIKNPLTPIQLSAERLKRKYLKQITQDPETFTACTDTIVRQVGDIGRMVDEFSSFARMPAPKLSEEDATDLCRQALVLQRSANPTIQFDADLPGQPVSLRCDSRQIGQALTNLIQNAVDAIQGREAPADTPLPPGHVVVRVQADPSRVRIAVDDNGRGLPNEARDRLTEPYVTTRTKGTGLGLAIVKKIMEDHGGDLVLEDSPLGGARVSLVFRKIDSPSNHAADGAKTNEPETVSDQGMTEA